MTTAAVAGPVLVNGHPIRARKAKQIAWSVTLGTLAFGLFASGLYFGGSQVHWYVHIGSFYWPGWWLKQGWDGGMGIIGPHTTLVNTANWTAQFGYRHAYRNIGLPALAMMGALSIAGGARKPGSRLYTAVAPFLVLATAVVLITGGMWLVLLLDSHLHLSVQQANWLHLAESVLLGFAIGRVLHPVWRPAGTRIQQFGVEKLVDRHWRGGSTRDMPFWYTHELLPPTALEAAAVLIAGDLQPGKNGAPSEAFRLATEGQTSRSQVVYWLAAACVLVVVGVDFVGFIGHIWDGMLHQTFPYLAP